MSESRIKAHPPMTTTLEIIRPRIFADVPSIVAGFSTRAGGASEGAFVGLNVGGSVGDDVDVVRANRHRLLDALGFAPDALATVGQVHGADVAVVTEPGHTPEHDGLATDRPGIALGIVVADCGAVLLADAEAGVVGACHAGWRGAVGEIPRRTVEAMQALGAEAGRIRAYVGPCIGPDDFEVGTEVAAQFDAAHVLEPPGAAKPHVDLAGAIAAQLRVAGVENPYMEVEGCSTFDTARFYSYRAEGGTTGRMMGVIGRRGGA